MNITTLNIYNAEFLVLVLQNNGCKTKDLCSNIINLRTFQDLRDPLSFIFFRLIAFQKGETISKLSYSDVIRRFPVPR